MARDVVDAQLVESATRSGRLAGGRLQTGRAFPRRRGARENPVLPRRSAPVPYEGARGIGALLRHADASGLGGDRGRRRADRALRSRRRRRDFAGAGRPVRTVGRAAADAFTTSRANWPRISRPRTRSPRPRHRLSRARHEPEMDAGARRRVMPKSRYRIMTRYMPKVGTRGLDMMYRTATVQANLDFSQRSATWSRSCASGSRCSR